MAYFDIPYSLKKDGKFWFIECDDYPVFTQGKTKEEAIDNLRDAFLLYVFDADAQKKYPELTKVASQIAVASIKPIMNEPGLPSPQLPIEPDYVAFTYSVGERAIRASL